MFWQKFTKIPKKSSFFGIVVDMPKTDRVLTGQKRLIKDLPRQKRGIFPKKGGLLGIFKKHPKHKNIRFFARKNSFAPMGSERNQF